MKMGKYISREKLSCDQISNIVHEGISYIHNWTKNEIKHISKDKTIIIKNNEGSYTVGTFSIKKVNDLTWKVEDVNKELVYNFSKKLSALMYCIMFSLKKYHNATEILDLDLDTNTLEAEFELFSNLLKISIKHKDDFKIDLYTARLNLVKSRLISVQNKLSKTLKNAKYIKAQLDTIHYETH